jgi:predicted dehydrogenase
MDKILLVGAGGMAQDYAKVLLAQNVDFDVICRTTESANKFTTNTGKGCYDGGLDKLLESTNQKYTKAIVATGVEALKETSVSIINHNILDILVEKPGGLNHSEIEELDAIAKTHKATIYIAYNRRFYASVDKALEIIKEDGGALSGNFEFTEWSHVIDPLTKAPGVKDNWFLANSTHVVDLAFFMMGHPKELSAYSSGETSWHKPAIFAGSGITEQEILFSYKANWISAGRWGVELLTRKRKLILQPMEKLNEQLVGSVQINEVQGIDYLLDEMYKPGVYNQTKHFLTGNKNKLKTLEEHTRDLQTYTQISPK